MFVVGTHAVKRLAQDVEDSLFWGHASSAVLQTPGGVTAVCWHANLPSAMLQLFWLPHLSQDMFITHRFRPKINVGTTHPGWVMNPPASSLAASDQRVYFLPFPPSFASPCPSHSYASVLYFFLQRNISQQGCAQQAPKLRLQRTSHYPSRWCANVAVDIKVFQPIIITGIHRRQLSLSYDLATICGVLAERCCCNSIVTLS